ncbi:MAG: [protein-PII] uridylyltransferase [Acidobacteria bacterium]|nr:[protein-PII] uridylyltransferase [Acidobacteriota bacterium]
MKELIPLELREWELTKEQFFSGGDGLSAVAGRTREVDRTVSRSFEEYFPSAEGVAAIAVGGYGREQLFPYSDVDLLLLVDKAKRVDQKDALSKLLADLWDAKLRLSHSVRTPAECTTLAPENSELHISLLDTRFLGGDRELYRQLSEQQLPHFYQREEAALFRNLIELSHARHRKHGRTIYHLEPDIKECPGGLRDFQLTCWISQLLGATDSLVPTSEQGLPDRDREKLAEAKRFLFAVRCYLHYFTGRDNNKLSFELQDRIAEAGSGKAFRRAERTEDWMRDYFRNVRVFSRLATRMMERAGDTRRSLLSRVRERSSRISHSDFSVARGRIFLKNSQALKTRPELALELFRWISRQGLPLAVETERRIEEALPDIEAYARSGTTLWPALADILKLPYAYRALTAMHETGALCAIFPEFELIDGLVIRDFYHRYTVDEHMFRAIRHVHELSSEGEGELRGYASLLEELEHPEYLYFAILFHDIGKGVPGPDHSQRSIELTDRVMERIGMGDEGRLIVRFLIRHHLTMSAFMRGRDVSEPDTIRELADIVGTTQQLKQLTLVTFADIRAVNPTAMTPWRRNLLWQLYVATYNRLTGDVEDNRIGSAAGEAFLDATGDERAGIESFIEGFPIRYLRTRSAEAVREHFKLSRKLADQDSVVSVTPSGALHEVVVITKDRPTLFASLCGALAAFGVSIEKAEAFSNQRGLVLDTFEIADPEHHLEASPNEHLQLSRILRKVAEQRVNVDDLLRAREPVFRTPPRAWIKPRLSVDNQTSGRATVLHVTAQDRIGLLYDLARTVSARGYDIEVVLIETQGRKAIDVFYVSGPEGKLATTAGERLRDALLAACAGGFAEKAS